MAYNGLRTEPEDTFTDPHSHDKATRGESLLTEANLGKHCSSGSRPGTSGGRSVKSGTSRSSKTSLSERRRRKKELALLAENAPRPWPDPDVYELRSLFCMTLRNPIRRAAIAAIEWPKRGSSFWDKKVLFVIGLNTITMAMYDCFDKPSMRACDPAEMDIPAGPYGYCNKMGTGPFPRASVSPLHSISGLSCYFLLGQYLDHDSVVICQTRYVPYAKLKTGDFIGEMMLTCIGEAQDCRTCKVVTSNFDMTKRCPQENISRSTWVGTSKTSSERYFQLISRSS